MTAPAPDTNCPAPSRSLPALPPGPRVATVVRRIATNLLVAIVVPTALFYVCLLVADIWVALVAALTWCYASVLWRMRTRRPTSALLWLTVAGLTGKTILAFATGSTLVYFLQPALGDAVVSAVFLLSLLTARPAVARLAAEFYPMTHDVAARPRVQSLFTRLTVMWAAICAVKAGVTLWLLQSLSVTGFVAAKTVFTPSAAVLGAAVTVALAVRVARHEGLLPAVSAA
ncbi:MAG TPA: VC0807 family protein [Mycobacteriales bacterium]|nr:VC0807 family protein [Mycobacteriales bacterium]